MRIYYYLVIIAIVILATSSCTTRKEAVYFQSLQKDTSFQSAMSYEPVLEADDLLLITVSSIDMEAVAPFNMAISPPGKGEITFSAQKTLLKYLVKKNGSIDFPVLGEVKVAGLTRQQAKDHLQQKLALYVKDAIVNLTITNFKITVLGEVKAPGTYRIEQERITILEALGMAGDLAITGQRTNVLVIREKEGEQQYFRVDLTGTELFSSPVYYLKQNDVIYVEPNQNRLNNAAYTPWIGVVFSAISLVLTVINLLI
jgi:polysaccharide export outer membrane protein